VAITVLLADDQRMVREGLAMVLTAEADIRVIGQAGDGAEAVAVARRLHPDVVVMDIRMPGVDGVEATRRLAGDGPGAPRVLVLTTYEIDEYIFEALRAGASGFMLKDAPLERFVDAVRVVAAGDALLAPSVTRRLLSEFAARPGGAAADDALAELTGREAEVLALVAKGMSNSEIAEHLVVGETTVKTHVSRILAKLALRDRVQAVVFAYEHGVVQAGS
jgi:DNA-binding NarL/FixJ family response regulator